MIFSDRKGSSIYCGGGKKHQSQISLVIDNFKSWINDLVLHLQFKLVSQICPLQKTDDRFAIFNLIRNGSSVHSSIKVTIGILDSQTSNQRDGQSKNNEIKKAKLKTGNDGDFLSKSEIGKETAEAWWKQKKLLMPISIPKSHSIDQ